ncbi:MAG TPA: FtsQ-type POTRA domain-containing protein [Limnochordia bacterium]
MESREPIAGRAPKGFYPALGLFCLALSLYAFARSPFFSLSRFEVRGSRTLSAGEIAELAGMRYGSNLFELDLRAAERRLREHPRIASAHLVRDLPRGVIASIVEREPVGQIETGSGWMAVDGQGRVLGPVRPADDGLPRIVVATPPSTLEPGSQIDLPDLLGAIQIAAHCMSAWPGRFSEIRAVRPDEIVGITRDGIRVEFGTSGQAAAKVAALQLVLDAARREGIAVASVNVRTPRAPAVRAVP